MKKLNWRAGIASALIAFISIERACAATREALVIGVSKYQAAGNLSQAVVDAEKIRAALVSTGFNTPAVIVNPTKADLDRELKGFSRRSRTAEAAVLYFAGHGLQYANDNWILPTDAKLELEQDIYVEATRLQDMVSQLSGPRLRIIVLDACRNNPFSVNWGEKRKVGDGLGRVPIEQIPIGTVVAFSAPAGQRAPDDGKYASALASAISTPGLELKQLFDRVGRAVAQGGNSALPEYIARYEGSFSFGGVDSEDNSFKIYPNVPGFVQSIDVREGATVTEGQVVLRLDDSKLQIAYNAVRAEMAALDALASSIVRELDGAKNLFERGEETIAVVWAAQSRFDANARDRIATSTKLRDAKVLLDGAIVRAPASGKLSRFGVKTGDYLRGVDAENPTLIGVIIPSPESADTSERK